jgi:hypothetical protein
MVIVRSQLSQQLEVHIRLGRLQSNMHEGDVESQVLTIVWRSPAAGVRYANMLEQLTHEISTLGRGCSS